MRTALVLLTVLAMSLTAVGPASARTLFEAGFEAADLSEWVGVQALAERAEVVEEGDGNRVGRFEVRRGDHEPATGSQRAEVVSGLEFRRGDIRYFRIRSRVESWDPAHWGMIWQIHDDTLGSPPLSLQILRYRSQERLILESGDGSDVYWETSLPDNEWFTVVIRIKFSHWGSLEVWFDGERQEMANGRRRLGGVDTIGNPPGYDKLGIYRSHQATRTAVVFHDGYWVSGRFRDPPG